MITVFADKYLYHIESFIPDEIDLHLYDPARGLPDNLEGVDALLIRTVTKIDEEAIQKLPDSIKLIATGSAGTDHVNEKLLTEKNIAFADAAGCNARSVSEYVATALLLWADDLGHELSSKKVGIIGVGHVGTEVDLLLNALGMTTICYDPPREGKEKEFTSAKLKDALSADILTFHTPLTREGEHPTFHWLNEQKLASHNYELIINTARGGVVDEQALQRTFIDGTVQNFVIDVWENEPIFNDLVACNAYIRTPHIAGYSKQAKLRASQIIAETLCNFFSIAKADHAQKEYPGPHSFGLTHPEATSLSDILYNVHPIQKYEAELKSLSGLPPKEKGTRFNRIRAEYPLRDEFAYISLPDQLMQIFPQLAGLRFLPK